MTAQSLHLRNHIFTTLAAMTTSIGNWASLTLISVNTAIPEIGQETISVETLTNATGQPGEGKKFLHTKQL